MRQTILGTQIAFSDLNATHAQKREEIKGFRKYIGCPVKVKDYIWGGLITRFDFSGLSDLLITVLMEGGATLCFPASDVYINPLELVFVVGDHSTDPWNVVGVFEVEAAAVRACTTSCHFVGPIQLNKAFPDITDWSNMYYPMAKNAVFEEDTIFEVPFDYFVGKECTVNNDPGLVLDARVADGEFQLHVQSHGSGGTEWLEYSEVFTSMSVGYAVQNPTKVRREALDEIATKIGNAYAEDNRLASDR